MEIQSIQFSVKIVVYEGHKFCVPDYTRYMACDTDGSLFAYAAKPEWDVGCNQWRPSSDAPNCKQIAKMVLGNINGQDTLQEVL